MMGSIIERVLHASTFPMLLVRPADLVAKQSQEKEREGRESDVPLGRFDA